MTVGIQTEHLSSSAVVGFPPGLKAGIPPCRKMGDDTNALEQVAEAVEETP